MSLKAKGEATYWSDFKSNVAFPVALTKNRKMSAIYSSSIVLQHDPPRYANLSSRRRRKRSPLSKRRNRSPSMYNEEGASTPRSFTKVQSKYAMHTAECCRLTLPAVFCRKHKVERSVTMTDSTGHKLWHMRFQQWSYPRSYIISNGWREFSYDHSLKLHDRLVFTLVSSSHFSVEFTTSNGSTCAMLPTRNRKDRTYPWTISYSRLDFLASVNNIDSSKVQLQAVEEKQIRKKVQVVKARENREKVASVILPTNKQKPQKEMFCQCNTVKVGNGKNITNNSRKAYVFPELTHLECKYPDGSPYLQIIDSDSEISGVDED